MHKILFIAVIAAVLGTAVPTFAQEKCPEGQHYDTAKKQCVPHG